MCCIEWTIDRMHDNLREARMYAGKAVELQQSDGRAADWAFSMARGHMGFNDTGRNILVAQINALEGSEYDPEYVPGMKYTYMSMLGALDKEAQEIKVMLEMYNR